MFKKKAVANGENTVVGAGTVIQGDIVSDAAIIRIDGEVKGKIDTKGDLIIGVEGAVNGDVVAANLNLGGRVSGNVKVLDRIQILSTGEVIGDIETKLMSMDERAIIQGKVSMVSEYHDNDEN